MKALTPRIFALTCMMIFTISCAKKTENDSRAPIAGAGEPKDSGIIRVPTIPVNPATNLGITLDVGPVVESPVISDEISIIPTEDSSETLVIINLEDNAEEAVEIPENGVELVDEDGTEVVNETELVVESPIVSPDLIVVELSEENNPILQEKILRRISSLEKRLKLMTNLERNNPNQKVIEKIIEELSVLRTLLERL